MMNSTKKSFLIALAAFMPFISCSPDPCLSKDQFVDSYRAFFEEFDKNSEELDAEQLAIFEKRYELMLENCYEKYKTDLSVKEKREFWKSSVHFYIDKEGGIFNIDYSSKDVEDPLRKYIVEELESMADSSSQDLNKLMESVLEDELPRLIDNVVDKLEEVGEQIKKSLKENK